MVIEFDHVTKKYLKNKALDDVSFNLDKGKIIGLIGANGSGKSTTLKLIAGLAQPNKGVIRIDGNPSSRLISNQVAYLSELDVFYDFYTVEQTIDYYASLFDDFDKEKAFEITHFMKLSPKQKVKHLSKGNRGRLKIAATLARNVPVILMDEPLSGLDPMVRESIIKGLISFIDLKNQLVLITTHEITEVESVLDDVIAIKDGKILGIKNVESLRTDENLSIVEWMKHIHQ